MAGKVVNSSSVLLSKFVTSGKESASKTATSHIRKTLWAINMRQMRLLSIFLILAACSYGTKQSDLKENVVLLWKNQHLDWITSSISISDNKIYFGSFNDTFYSAKLKNGEPTLKFKTGYDPYFSPIVNHNKIYFSSFDLNIYCIDTLGNLLWQTSTDGRVKNDLIEDDSLIFASVRGDGLRAINKNDGLFAWYLPQASQSLSTSQPIIFDNKIFLGMWELDNNVIAINKQTGQILWSNNYSGYSSSDPALSKVGLVVSIDKFYKGGQVKMLDYNTGKEIWATPLNCEALYKPLTYDNNIIVSTYDNKIVCLDNSNGKIKWTLNLENEENASTNIRSFKENIYFGTTKRNLYCVDIKTGETIFKEPFNYGISEPIVANEKIYFPTGGNELWTLKK